MPSKTRKRFTGLGEGRSKSIYVKPTMHDTAVLIAFFNPAKFKRILKNALYIMKILKDAQIPYFVAECTFHSSKPQLPNPTLVVNSDSYMFYKEQLLNKLETVVPSKYTKLVFLDADILLDTPDWIDQISVTLNRYDIIQPFSQACWLTPDNIQIRSKKLSYACAIVTNKPINLNTIHDYHPGFVWGINRDIFRKVGGFFTHSIIGGGDVSFILNLFPNEVTDEIFFTAITPHFGKIIIDAWRKYNENFKKVKPTIGFLYNKALHLFHGIQQNRQYATRYQDISTAMTGAWEDEIITNSDGLFEFKRPEINTVVLAYFKGRNEDISLTEANKVIKEGYKGGRIVRKRDISGTRKIRRIPIKHAFANDNTIVTLPS